MIKLLIGTNRPEANSRKVAHQIAGLYKARGIEVGSIDLADLPTAIFEPSAYAAKPAAFRPFAEAVLESSGLHIVTPEYNGGFPGVLKYFIDMLPFPESLENRPVAFTGVAAGQFGALRPIEQLQQIFGYRNAYLFPERVFIMGVGDLMSEGGRIEDPAIVGRLESQACGFNDFVGQLR